MGEHEFTEVEVGGDIPARSGERQDARADSAAAHPSPARAGHEALRPRAESGSTVVKVEAPKYTPVIQWTLGMDPEAKDASLRSA